MYSPSSPVSANDCYLVTIERSSINLIVRYRLTTPICRNVLRIYDSHAEYISRPHQTREERSVCEIGDYNRRREACCVYTDKFLRIRGGA